MNLLQYTHLCWQAWRMLRTRPIVYLRIVSHQVPSGALLVARDREAWRLTQFAIDSEFSNFRS